MRSCRKLLQLFHHLQRSRRVLIVDQNDLNELKHHILAANYKVQPLHTIKTLHCSGRHVDNSIVQNSAKIARHSMEAFTSSKDAGYGTVLGAFAGDAAGGVLEFLPAPPSSSQVDNALTMCGGGVWQLGPGQVSGCQRAAQVNLMCCLACVN